MHNTSHPTHPLPNRVIVLLLLSGFTVVCILAGYYQDLYRQERRRTTLLTSQLSALKEACQATQQK